MAQPANRTIALVTGANQGIGRAVATSLAKDHGFHVVVGARRLEAGEAVAAELRAAGCAASAAQLDLTSDASIAAAAAGVGDAFGRLDVLVHNAGVLLDSDSPFRQNPALPTRELFERTFQANVFGAACLTEALLPLLRRAAAAPRVVFVSSVMGSLAVATDTGTPMYGIDYKAYDASKTALNMLMLNYARILADVGGRVNAACPGLVSTSMLGFSPQGVAPEVGARRVVELATLGPDGPSGTFSNSDGPLPW